jgi:glycosyltransferase involved in cell wall biosynthesis
VSHAEAALVESHFPAVRTKITVVPNAVDFDTVRAVGPLVGEPSTILAVGRLEAYKRFDLLIEALARIAAPSDDVQLVIVGTGPERGRLEDAAVRLGVVHRVRFLGGLSDAELYSWFRTANVFASLSEHEAYGLAPAEALVAGTRVVLSTIPAHRELVADAPGYAAQLVSASVTDVAQALQTALHASTLDQSMHDIPGGPNPASFSAGILSWDQVVRALLDVFSAAEGNSAHAGALGGK